MSRFFASVILLLSGMHGTWARAQYAIVDAGYSGQAGARVDGVPHFATISAALATVPADRPAKPYLIYIKNGRYEEKLRIARPNVHLIGEIPGGTILTYTATSDTPAPQGGTYGTRGSFTLQVAAPDFRAENLTIENGFDYPANAAKAENDPRKIRNPQAVALMTTQGSDRAVFCNCTIRGYQDTVFADAGRHYFYGCRVLGHVDFIFGAGQAVFENCEIISRDRPGKNPTGYITAPSTKITYPYGFLFLDCKLLKETPALPPGSVRLGRPWHPDADPRVEGSAVFVRCFMDDHIGPQGYARISARDSNTGERIWFEVKPDSRFFEYGSYGPGAIDSPTRPTLSENAVQWYSVSNVLNGWRPTCTTR